jgi:hypothetical protein
MAKAIFGNHASAFVPRQDRDSIRKFCDVLGGKVAKADPERDLLRLGEDCPTGHRGRAIVLLRKPEPTESGTIGDYWEDVAGKVHAALTSYSRRPRG